MMFRDKLAGVVLAGLCLAAGPAAAQAPANETPADWKRRPSGESIAEHYPVIAQVLGMSGQVMLVCRVDTNGLADPCAIARESPTGLGFGRAARRSIR